MGSYDAAGQESSGPFPPGTPLDLLSPTPRETTVLARCRTVLGIARAAALSRGDLGKIGARTAANFRSKYGQEPPQIGEDHPELGGVIMVKCYPGAVAVTLLDEAIRVILDFETKYTAPPAPPPKPTHPHGPSERDKLILDI